VLINADLNKIWKSVEQVSSIPQLDDSPSALDRQQALYPKIVQESPHKADQKAQQKLPTEISPKFSRLGSNESNISLGETGSNLETSPGIKPTINGQIPLGDSISNPSPKLCPLLRLKPKVEASEPKPITPSAPPRIFYQRLPTHMVNKRRKSNEKLMTVLRQVYTNEEIPKIWDTYLQKATSPGPGTPMPSSQKLATLKLKRSLSVEEPRNKKPSQPTNNKPEEKIVFSEIPEIEASMLLIEQRKFDRLIDETNKYFKGKCDSNLSSKEKLIFENLSTKKYS
jgi:hypothetical protein